jgi:hypothetical protein
MDPKLLPSSTSDSSSNSRSFLSSTRSWLPGGRESHTPDDKIGPLGLNTLSIPSCSAANVIADVVFVHGLGGGSRKTWTKSGDPALYWPKEWLPNDEALQDIRIHRFGYDSNWGKKSVLGIHDFADALLNSILDCPSIPRDSKVGPFPFGIRHSTQMVEKCFWFQALEQQKKRTSVGEIKYLRDQLLISN